MSITEVCIYTLLDAKVGAKITGLFFTCFYFSFPGILGARDFCTASPENVPKIHKTSYLKLNIKTQP